MAILRRARTRSAAGRTRSPRDLRGLNEAMAAAGTRVRGALDAAGVMETLAEEAYTASGAARAGVWRVGDEGPELVHQVPSKAQGNGEMLSPPSTAPPLPPGAVLRCAENGATGANGLTGTLTVPVAAPTAGTLAVLHLEGVGGNFDLRSSIESLATEAGQALEAAALRDEVTLEREKSDAILGRIGDGVVVTDEGGVVSQVNEAGERILGCTATDAIGRSCHQALGLTLDGTALDCSHGCPLLDETLGDPVLGHEAVRNLGDGRRQPLLVKVEALRGADGGVAEVVHSMRDITKLREADEAKSMFLATASHELKTPLTVILGYSDSLRNDPWWKEEDRNRALDAVQRRSKQLADIVDRLLLSSRIEAGRHELTVSEVDVRPLIQERVRSMVDATGREIVADVDSRTPLARANGDAMITVVDHLVDNAAKYSPDGGRIEVSAKPSGCHVAVAVSDEGIGMTPEEAANCLKKFWQAESSDERRFGGTGIGLFIVHSLVTQMGGELTVESQAGHGTRFTVQLDRADGGRDEEEMEAPEITEGPIAPERSMVKEFMRQMGVPEGERR